MINLRQLARGVSGGRRGGPGLYKEGPHHELVGVVCVGRPDDVGVAAADREQRDRPGAEESGRAARHRHRRGGQGVCVCVGVERHRHREGGSQGVRVCVSTRHGLLGHGAPQESKRVGEQRDQREASEVRLDPSCARSIVCTLAGAGVLTAGGRSCWAGCRAPAPPSPPPRAVPEKPRRVEESG